MISREYPTGISECKRQKSLQPLPGLQFACNTTTLAMVSETCAHRITSPTRGEEQASPHSINLDAQSLQLRSSSPICRAPSCLDPFHSRCEPVAKTRSLRLYTPLEPISTSFDPQRCDLTCMPCQDVADGPSSILAHATPKVNTRSDAPAQALDLAIVQSFNTIATECPNVPMLTPRCLLTPRSNCSRPSAFSNTALQTVVSPPTPVRPLCAADDAGRSTSCTPSLRTPVKQLCQQRLADDARLHAPYRTSPLPSRVDGIRRFACSNSSDEDDDDDAPCHQRHSNLHMACSASGLSEHCRSYQLMPPPLLQRLSPPDRRSSDGGSSGAGRLVCNLVERFNNTQLYDALNTSP